MNSLQSIVILLIGVYTSGNVGVEIDDFEAAAKSLIVKFVEQHGDFEWWDLYAKHNDLVNNADAQRQKTTVTVDNVGYAFVPVPPPKPIVYGKEVFDNQGSKPKTFEYSRTLAMKNIEIWKIERTLKVGVKVGFPDRVNFPLDLQDTKELIMDRTEIIVEKSNLTIPPDSTLVVTLTVTEEVRTTPWFCHIDIKPKVAVWYKEKSEGQNLRYFDVDLSKLDSNGFKGYKGGVKYSSKGTSESVKYTNLRLDTKIYKYGTYEGNAADPVPAGIYYVPLFISLLLSLFTC